MFYFDLEHSLSPPIHPFPQTPENVSQNLYSCDEFAPEENVFSGYTYGRPVAP